MRHIWGLDLLRFVAAALVVFFHLRAFGLHVPDYDALPAVRAFPWLEPYAWFGWVGVQVFFIISGFVIAASAMAVSIPAFAARRAIRILPALWVSTLIGLAIRLAWGEPFATLAGPLVKSMLLSPIGPYIDGVVWTLVVELVFYVYIAILIALSARLGGRRAAFEIGAYALGLASVAFNLVHLAVAVRGMALETLLARFFIDVTLLRHGVFFAFGMLVFYAWTHGANRRIMAAVPLFGCAGCVQIMLKSGLDSAFWLPVTVWLASAAAMLASLPLSRHALPPRLARASTALGLLTYPLYLNHFTVGQYLVPFLSPTIRDRTTLLIVTIAAMLALAALVMKGPEQPIQRWMRQRFALLRGRRPVAASLP